MYIYIYCRYCPSHRISSLFTISYPSLGIYLVSYLYMFIQNIQYTWYQSQINFWNSGFRTTCSDSWCSGLVEFSSLVLLLSSLGSSFHHVLPTALVVRTRFPLTRKITQTHHRTCCHASWKFMPNPWLLTLVTVVRPLRPACATYSWKAYPPIYKTTQKSRPVNVTHSWRILGVTTMSSHAPPRARLVLCWRHPVDVTVLTSALVYTARLWTLTRPDPCQTHICS